MNFKLKKTSFNLILIKYYQFFYDKNLNQKEYLYLKNQNKKDTQKNDK